jgi:hypothetical protein
MWPTLSSTSFRLIEFPKGMGSVEEVRRHLSAVSVRLDEQDSGSRLDGIVSSCHPQSVEARPTPVALKLSSKRGAIEHFTVTPLTD